MNRIIYASLTILGLALSSLTATAQSYYVQVNKDNPADVQAGFVAATFTANKKDLIVGATKDTLSAVQTLPFSMTIYGKTVTSYKASDNGYITFDTTETKSYPANVGLPVGKKDGSQNAIYASWYDWSMGIKFQDGSTASKVYSSTFGTTGDRTHIIQWTYMQNKATGGGYATFVLFLKEKDSRIYVLQGSGFAGTTSAYTVAAQNTVGINLDSKDGNSFNDNINPFSFGSFYSIKTGVQPNLDLKLVSLTNPRIILATNNFNASILIQNFSKKPLNSITVNTLIEGKTTTSKVDLSANPTGANGGYGQLSITNLKFANTSSSQKLKVWISSPNDDTAKVATPEDDTISNSVRVVGTYVKRKVLYEQFTSATCNPCAYYNGLYNDTLKALIDENLITPIRYQGPVPVPGDPMYTFAKANTDTRQTYYKVPGFPNSVIDGNVYSGNTGNLINNPQIIRNEAKIPALASINMTYSSSGNTYTVKATVTPNFDFTPNSSDPKVGDYRLFASVHANLITYPNNSSFLDANQSNWNKETEFLFVNRKMIPNASGILLDAFKAGTPNKEITLSYTYDANVEKKSTPADMRMVVWVQNLSTGEVIQSEMTGLGLLSNGIEDQSKPNINATMFPNPSNGTTTIRFELLKSSQVAANVMDMQGRTVLNVQDASRMVSGQNQLSFDASTLNKGIYFVNITVDGVNTSKKLIVE